MTLKLAACLCIQNFVLTYVVQKWSNFKIPSSRGTVVPRVKYEKGNIYVCVRVTTVPYYTRHIGDPFRPQLVMNQLKNTGFCNDPINQCQAFF